MTTRSNVHCDLVIKMFSFIIIRRRSGVVEKLSCCLKLVFKEVHERGMTLSTRSPSLRSSCFKQWQLVIFFVVRILSRKIMCR